MASANYQSGECVEINMRFLVLSNVLYLMRYLKFALCCLELGLWDSNKSLGFACAILILFPLVNAECTEILDVRLF